MLQRLDGVREVNADHHTGLVQARIDPQRVSREQVARRLAAAGFEEVSA